MNDHTSTASTVKDARIENTSLLGDDQESTKCQIVAWLKDYLADLTGLGSTEIDVDCTFDRYGIDSYQGAVIMCELSEWLGREIDAADIFEHPSIADLASFLSAIAEIRLVLQAREPW